AIVLFGVPATKDAAGSQASDPNGIAQLGLKEPRDELGESTVLISDLCPDEYTDHGHCGVLADDNEVDNDRTLDRDEEIALAQAEAGADIVAPSGMMDGQVAAIRDALADVCYPQSGIPAYAVKIASALYWPFVDA